MEEEAIRDGFRHGSWERNKWMHVSPVDQAPGREGAAESKELRIRSQENSRQASGIHKADGPW